MGSVWLVCAGNALATVTVTAATGGTGLSADTAQNGATPGFTTLGNIVLDESANGDFTPGTGVTLILTAPTGWRFKPGAGSATSTGKDIPSSNVSLSVSDSNIIVTFNVTGTGGKDTLTISGIQIQATDGGALPASGSIFRSSLNPGTATIAGITSTANANGSGGSNFGSLSQVIGAASLFVVMPGQSFTDGGTVAASGISGTPVGQTAGVAFNLARLVAADRQFNISTAYTGARRLATVALEVLPLTRPLSASLPANPRRRWLRP